MPGASPHRKNPKTYLNPMPGGLTGGAEARGPAAAAAAQKEVADDLGKHPPEVADVDVGVPLREDVAKYAVPPALHLQPRPG